MIKNSDFKICFSVMTVLTILVGLFQSWGIALSMLNLCLISAVMAMGVNIQWGFAGLINFGVMGFLAIGGLATVLISVPPVPEAWSAGGIGNALVAFYGGFLIAFSEIGLTYAYKKFFKYIMPEGLEPSTLIQFISTDYKFAISFAILIVVLIFRPNGIFKGKVI